MKQTTNIWTWFKSLSEGWRTITILSGFVVAVAVSAVAIDHFKTKVSDASSVLKYLQKQDTIQTNRHKETTLHLKNISDSLKLEYQNQNIFQENYSHFVSSKTGSVSEWMKYMNGMKITVVEEPYVPTKAIEESKPVFKIHIEKDTIKNK